MGTDIATAFLEADYEVTLLEANSTVAEGAASRIEKRLPANGRLRLAGLADLDGDAGIVIEAITESLEAKRELLAQVSLRVAPEVAVFSNTSTLSIEALATSVRAPERFAGLHFFFPAHRNPFLEVVSARRTAPRTLDAAAQLAIDLRKDHVVCNDRPGFVVNAFYLPLVNEAVRLVDEQVASAAQVDAVAKAAFGVRVGPLAVTKMMNPQTTHSTLASLADQGACTPVSPSIVSGAARDFDAAGTAAPLADAVAARVRDRLLAAVMLPCLRMLDAGDAQPQAIDLAATRALQFGTPPIQLVNSLGRSEVERILRLVLNDWGGTLPDAVAQAGKFITTTE